MIRTVTGFVKHQLRMRVPLPALPLIIRRRKLDFTDAAIRRL